MWINCSPEWAATVAAASSYQDERPNNDGLIILIHTHTQAVQISKAGRDIFPCNRGPFCMFVLVLPPLGISQQYSAYLFLLLKMKHSLLFYTFPFKGCNVLVAASKANLTCRRSWLGSFPACERKVVPHEERLFLLSSLWVIHLSLGFLVFLMPLSVVIFLL